MSSNRLLASTAWMAGILVATLWCGVLMLPLTASSLPAAADRAAAQTQAQPRDPRPGVARPASARERELQAASVADPTNVTNWIETARLQEQRNAFTDAETTLKSAMAATSASRDVVAATAAFYTRRGEFDKAIAALEEAARRSPEDPAGYHLLSVYYMEKAQKDPALTQGQKLAYVDSGIAASDRALAVRSDYTNALVCKNTLLRLKAGLVSDPSLKQQLTDEADQLRSRATELQKAQQAPSDPTVLTEVDGQAPVRVGGNIKVPTKIRHVAPVYPPEALASGIAGVVIIEALIDSQGMVKSTHVLRSIPLLDEAAVDSVKEWQFVPTLLNGAPVPVLMTVTVNFTIAK